MADMTNNLKDKSGKKPDELTLTDLVDVEMLQRIQDAFSEMTGMAALTTDANGNPVTKGSNFTDFCFKYTRNSTIGRARCELCDKLGAEISLQTGKPFTYRCHAGLVDFAAPIMANGVMIGSFIGGQVLPEEPEPDKFIEIANELGIDSEAYVAAVGNVRVADKETIDKAANSLYTIANVLSDTAYKSHCLYQNATEVEKASTAKSDFLANMSHEIRTPMNAILGMVDLALREEMSPAARDFIKQIKISGKNLLVLINDILDFSKIEAGKLDIIEAEYEPMSVINDVANIVNNRIGGKNIEFTLDISSELPRKLLGDSFRIHQILINLLNNAVKFTKEGEVHLSLKCEPVDADPESILIIADIRDTGIGIKKEDIPKLFHSFEQLDSKRNRNIEGTGLGLAISQQLLRLMNGKISVQSVYEKGTTFTFCIPQKVVDSAYSVPELDTREKVAVLVENPYVYNQLCKDLFRINAEYKSVESIDELSGEKYSFVIVEECTLTDELFSYLRQNSDVTCIAMTSYTYRNTINDIPNLKILRKPVYSLALYNVMGLGNFVDEDDCPEANVFTFIAPDAHVLIVDDNTVNLEVAKGLLEPLEMHIDTVESAQAAIEMLQHKPYDLIFMDHMMPEVDGVEATHIIRRLMPEYDNVPIIALTANAINGAKEMFIKEGMNDFVAKPIELTDITDKLRKWLPQDKLISVSSEEMAAAMAAKKEENPLPETIGNLNVAEALRLLGSRTLFRTVLKEFFCTIDKKSQSIEQHLVNGEIHDYTIEVHALKSSSRQIGADEVSELAAELEKAGNEENLDFINEKTPILLEKYRSFKAVLEPLFPECMVSAEKKDACTDETKAMLDAVKQAIESFDTLEIDECVEKMSQYEYPEEQAAYLEELKSAADECDLDLCSEIIGKWLNFLAD